KMDPGWKSRLVRGTNIRLWIEGEEDLTRYETMVSKVWHAFPDYFTYPLPDSGTPCDESNPDSAVDMYLVIGSTLDPRNLVCAAAQPPPACTLRGVRAAGATIPTPSTTPSKSSAYMLIDIDTFDNDGLMDTIAHELAHAGQCAYDAHDDVWLHESTAT